MPNHIGVICTAPLTSETNDTREVRCGFNRCDVRTLADGESVPCDLVAQFGWVNAIEACFHTFWPTMHQSQYWSDVYHCYSILQYHRSPLNLLYKEISWWSLSALIQDDRYGHALIQDDASHHGLYDELVLSTPSGVMFNVIGDWHLSPTEDILPASMCMAIG